jgi:integrase
MQFDARHAKLLAPGEHIIIEDCPGLRLSASGSGRVWIYRYKSPIDGRMRQTKIGQWPAMPAVAALAEWERLRSVRDAGRDPAKEKRLARGEAKAAAENERKVKLETAYTVCRLCDDYLAGHVARNRKAKGAKELARMFRTMLGDLGDAPAATVSRSQAFNLLESFLHIPVQCATLRAELGAAWDYALDAGRLPDSTPNWWRLIMRGRIKSKGKNIEGVKTGTVKRVLSEAELSVLIPWLPNFSRTVGDALTMYLWTCSRGAEIMTMEAHEIAEEADGLWWTIPKQKTKNARHENATDQRVPLVGRAAVIVRRRLQQVDKGYLFPSTGKEGHIEQKRVQTAVFWHQPYCVTCPGMTRPRLPVTHWAPHDLRRTSRTLLAALGCPDAVAEATLGHMQAGIRGVYNLHSYDRERREWVTRLDRHLESLLG